MLVRSWKHQSLLPCHLKLWSKIVGVVDPTKLKQNLPVFWKLMNLRDCVWEIHCQIITKTILQEKETIHYSMTTWFTNLFLCLKLWKFMQWKQRRTRNGKIGGHLGVELDDSQKQIRGDRWSKDVGRKSSLCIINGHMSFEKRWIGGKAPKYKGRVVLRGDIVKDDSGSYAVFTEQGSSASQMTAAKIMDIISRLPGCDGQAADAVSA